MKFHLGTNWKMSKTNSQARQFVAELLPLLRGEDLSKHYLFVIPSFTAVEMVHDAVSEAALSLNVGAQNVHWEDGVEATGEISARILADIPVDLIEIGHSERRQKFSETDEDVNRKARAAIAQNLPNSRIVQIPFRFLSILDDSLKLSDSGCSYPLLPRPIPANAGMA